MARNVFLELILQFATNLTRMKLKPWWSTQKGHNFVLTLSELELQCVFQSTKLYRCPTLTLINRPSSRPDSEHPRGHFRRFLFCVSRTVILEVRDGRVKWHHPECYTKIYVLCHNVCNVMYALLRLCRLVVCCAHLLYRLRLIRSEQPGRAICQARMVAVACTARGEPL